MQFKIDWNRFNDKNPNVENSFEEMCRHLFCRKFSITGYDFQSNYNQTGLEIEPILFENKNYGFQCKYVKNSPYKQVEESLNKAFDAYKDIDCIYVYTNADIKPNCTVNELGKNDTPRTRLYKKVCENKVKWVTLQNFTSILNEENNLDIAAFYFGIGKEKGFINNCISKNDAEFLSSEAYLSLKLKDNENKLCSINEIVNKSKVSLLKGDPGTGKSEILKKVFLNYSNAHAVDRDIIYKVLEQKIMPIFIQLKELVNGDIENIIRCRMADFGLNMYAKHFTYLYILDGIDEVSFDYANNISLFIKRLLKENSTYSILLSSRTHSSNITVLKNVLLDIEEYYIDKLNVSDIENYFNINKNDNKQLHYNSIKSEIGSLIKEIVDIFSIKLLWDNIEKINIETTKIGLIDESIKMLLNGRRIHELNLLENKADKIRQLCRAIAVYMQKNKKLSIELASLQQLINNEFLNLENNDVNKIVAYLKEIFFSAKEHNFSQSLFTFSHRRYQEYFLYEKLRLEFLNNPKIIRELNILSNKEFMTGVFFPQMKSECRESQDLIGTLSLDFVWDYLGPGYWYKLKNTQMPLRNDWGSSEPEYKLSEELLYAVAAQTPSSLEILLSDEDLPLSDYFNDKKRYIKALEVFHRYGHEKQARYFLNLISTKIDKKEQQNLIWDNSYSFIYYRYKILGDSLLQIINDLPDISNDNSIEGYKRLESPLKSMVRSFYKIVLEFDPSFIVRNSEIIPKCHLNIICDELCETKNVILIIMNNDIKNGVRDVYLKKGRVKKEDIAVPVILKLINYKDVSTMGIEEYFKSINTGNILTWDRRRYLNVLLAALYSKQENIIYPEAKNQSRIMGIVLSYFNDNQVLMIQSIIQELGEMEKMNSFEMSQFLGIMISFLKLPVNLIKKYLNALARYTNKVGMSTIFYFIKENNPDMYSQISNPGMIKRMFTESKEKGITSYYGDYTETLLQFAKMIADFDFEQSYLIVRECINAGILRPCFRKEDIVDYVLCNCLKIAKENFWYTDRELTSYVSAVRDMIILMQESTDGGGRSNYYNYVLKEYLPNLYDKFSIDGGSSSHSEKYNQNEISIEEIKQSLNIQNIKKYYMGDIEADYSSKELWEILISYEKEKTGRLDILFKCFEESHYPYVWGFGNCEYHHIPTAILWKDSEWSHEIKNFMMKQGGRTGLYNTIKMCGIIGEDELGKKFFEQFIRLCELLVFE